MQSIKKQLEPTTFKEVDIHKSAGILDDYAIRKDIQTRTMTGEIINAEEIILDTLSISSGTIIDSSGAINFDNEDLTTTGAINGEIGSILSSNIVDLVYPVGCIYQSVVSTSPATLFGGTWTAFGTGRMLVGRDATQTEFDTVEETGGSKLAGHTHGATFSGGGGLDAYSSGPGLASGTFRATGSSSISGGGATNSTVAGSTLPPYIVVYMWKRTA